MDKLKENKPTADILMISMRAMGYSFESAIADIIDNSISASAHNIWLRFPVDPTECYVAICDDGWGMSRDELVDAMKYGSEQKREERATDDLGRFGLGLKAASLSQCRRLTVVSKKDGDISAYIWDLDIILKKKDWYMVECTPEDIAKLHQISWLESRDSGTIVIWENFDLIEKSSGNVYSELNKLQDATANYVSLIFHRFLNKAGAQKLCIKINNYEAEGLDPFLENHRKTNVRRKIEIPIEDSKGIERMVVVQPFVLPFQKDLTLEDKKLSGGIENYRSKQGFYVYRNERLIVWGTWFGRHRDELTKYARIRVDIPNTLDDIWGIDIKKQSAKIPALIRVRLTRAVDDAMDVAVKAQKFRGRVDKKEDKIDYIWLPIKTREEQHSFLINREAKIFDLIKDRVDDETWSRIDMVLEEIESNLPYQQIYIDKSQNKIDDMIDEERIAEIEAKARILIEMALGMGNNSRENIVDALFVSEPFNNFPQLKEKLLEE